MRAKKDTYFWIEVSLKEVLGLLPPSCSTFQVKARLYRYLNFIAVRKYNFLFFFFLVQNLCCNDSEYHSLN